MYNQQWNLPKIQTNAAWDVTTGSGAVIAIFDDGVDLYHDDLVGNLLRDGSGNVIGYNATNRGASNDPQPDGDDAHGTACAGIVGAAANNGIGVSGIAPSSRIMPLQMSYTHPVYGAPYLETRSAWWINSLNFAVSNGADVVSMSVGLSYSAQFSSAMANAASNGVILVAAAGNDGAPSVSYPASDPNVIAVGASLQDDSRWSGSNYGPNLDLVAPGGAPIIWTTDRPGSIGYV